MCIWVFRHAWMHMCACVCARQSLASGISLVLSPLWEVGIRLHCFSHYIPRWQTHLLSRLSFLQYMVLKHSSTVSCLILCCIDHYGFVVRFEVMHYDASPSFFLHNSALYILNLVSFHMNFVIVFSGSVENAIDILKATTLSLWMVLSRMDKGIVFFQSLRRSCLSVLCYSMISIMFLEGVVWWCCEFHQFCLSGDIFFFPSLPKVNIAGYNILGGQIELWMHHIIPS